jgi:hypothetical protein
MELLKTLERAGFELNLRPDGKRINVRRTRDTQMSAQAAAPLLAALEKRQAEAVQAMQPRSMVIDPIGDQERLINSGTLSPIDEAIEIHQYAYMRGHRMCSDGTTHAGNIRRLKGGQS